MASTYLTRTFGSAGNRKKWTWSGWIKRNTNASGFHGLFEAGRGTNPFFVFSFYEDGINVANTAGVSADWNSTRKFRDTNGFYHVMLVVDTTSATSTMNGSSTDRMRVYVNNEQVVLSGGSVPSQNADLQVNQAIQHNIGGYNAISNMFDGIMSHVHFCDGYAYSPTDFGETDSTTGEWKIKTNPSVTYGTNGFFILKDGNSVTDQSGNSNNFTVGGGTLTKTEDCPSNVFATMNALFNSNSNLTYANGNTKPATTAQWLATFSTLPMFQGKYYWEFKGDPNFMVGVAQLNSDATETVQMSTANTGYSSRFATGYEIINGGNKSNNNNSSTSYGPSYSSSDIGMIAFDATNGVLWFGKNGTWSNSATQTQIENGTSTNAAYTGLTNSNGYVASCSVENGHVEFNFGNGYFGTTAVSSAGTNASGNGIFEYDVPNGYTALSTKGLNE